MGDGERRTTTVTRRDALVALTAAGALAAAGMALPRADWSTGRDASTTDTTASETDLRRLATVANAVYPSAVTATPSFVDTYVGGLSTERRRAMLETLADLDREVDRFGAGGLDDISPADLDALLHRMSVHRVRSVGDGVLAQRVRHHLVNALLFLLFTTPAGSRLVGVENPVGYPGGYESYRRVPGSTGAPDGVGRTDPAETTALDATLDRRGRPGSARGEQGG